MKFLHAADIHLDSPLRGLERYEGAPVREIRGATRRAFDNLVELAIDEAVDFVIIAGDVYDGDWKDYNTGLYFASRMSKLRDAGIPVYMLTGNHDAASVITRKLRMPDNVHTFSNTKPKCFQIEALHVAIVGQGFANRAVHENLSENYPQGDPQLFNIGVLHTCLDGKPGHDPYAPCSVSDLRSKGYQYWALGHIHTREVVSTEPYIVFPGNIQGRHARETGPKGCTLVSVEDRTIVAVEHRDLDVMRWASLEVDVTGSTTTDEVYEQVREALEQCLDTAEGRSVAARLTMMGTTAAHQALQTEREHWIQEYRSLATGLAGSGIWVEKVSFKTRASVSIDDLAANDDALSSLLRSVDSKELDSSLFEQFTEELSPLRQKLPEKMLTDRDDPYDPASEEAIAAALDDIRQLLADRLTSTEHGDSAK